MIAKLTRLTHQIMIQLHVVAESCTICSSHFRQPVQKLLDAPLYISIMCPPQLYTGIVRELVLSTGGDDDMGTLLGMMHSAPPSALQLKAHILKVST